MWSVRGLGATARRASSTRCGSTGSALVGRYLPTSHMAWLGPLRSSTGWVAGLLEAFELPLARPGGHYTCHYTALPCSGLSEQPCVCWL